MSHVITTVDVGKTDTETPVTRDAWSLRCDRPGCTSRLVGVGVDNAGRRRLTFAAEFAGWQLSRFGQPVFDLCPAHADETRREAVQR